METRGPSYQRSVGPARNTKCVWLGEPHRSNPFPQSVLVFRRPPDILLVVTARRAEVSILFFDSEH